MNDTITHAATGVYDVAVERAVRQLVTGLRSALATRKAHPSYGYTKADLRERLAQVEGAAFAAHALANGGPSASPRAAASQVLHDLGIDLGDLHDRVNAA